MGMYFRDPGSDVQRHVRALQIDLISLPLLLTLGHMPVVKRVVVDGLEVACRATRWVEWIPGWHHVYPRCLLARLSNQLDHHWGLGGWPTHSDDEWDRWFDTLSSDELVTGHWHTW